MSAGPRRRSQSGRHAARPSWQKKEAAEKAAEQQEIVEEAAAEEASRKASISRKQARAARIAADQAEEEEDIKLVDPETAMHAARRRSGILSFRSLLVLILAAAAAYLSFAPSFEAAAASGRCSIFCRTRPSASAHWLPCRSWRC